MGLQVRHQGMSPGLGTEGATSNGDNAVPTPQGTGHGADAALGSHGLTYSSMLMGQESGTAAAWQERPEGTR